MARPRKVLIIGGGAAGMSSAYAFSQSPVEGADGRKLEVTLFERAPVAGGMATSVDVDESKYGAAYINDGVQGASPVFHNTFTLFGKLGFSSAPVGLQASFGKEQDEFWSNVFPSPVIDKYQDDIKRFGKVLSIIKTFEPIFAMIPVSNMLSMFRFSQGFGEVIVYPLVALFFGTGNQTPFISSAILERVFKDPSMRLFEYDPHSFLASIPEMRSFPKLGRLYATWANLINSSEHVRVRTSIEVVSVSERNSKEGAKVRYRHLDNVNNELQGEGAGEIKEGRWDEIIFACDADSSLKILGKDATWKERRVLGNVKYLWDVTVTHNDAKYMSKYYNMTFDAEKMKSDARKDDAKAQEQYAFAQDNFKPLYYIRSYPDDKRKIEMSFDLANYQAQFSGMPETGPEADGVPAAEAVPRTSDSTSATRVAQDAATGKKPEAQEKEVELERHIFQTIFLDRDGSSHKWSKEEIAGDKIILEKWWKQQSHRWQHYAGTVPWMMFINGKNHSQWAGAWTILNMHEIAIVSGFSAAYRLGAKYPFADNDDCKRLFALYLGASHGKRMRGEDRKGFFA